MKNKVNIEHNSNISIEKNMLVELLIDDIGADGEGIGRYGNFTLFVKNAVMGDKIIARILKVKKNYGYAKLERILEPSSYRVKPRCPLALRCGGCQLQQVNYKQQLKFKQDKVCNCLKRIGGINVDAIMEPIVGMSDPYYYRNKAQFPVGRDKDGKLSIGFYAERSHSIINTDECFIQAKVNQPIVAMIRKFIEKYDIEPYQEEIQTGLIRHILTRIGFTTGEIMVCLVINGEELPYQDELAKCLRNWNQDGEWEQPFYHITSFCLNINKESTNVILGQKLHSVFGPLYITDTIGNIKYQISPLSFYQVNPIQTKKLYDLVLEFADLHGSEIVWDLYCGIGTISLFLAEKAKMVYGVEIIQQAIEDAKRNAQLNGITNALFFEGAAEEVLPQKYSQSNGSMSADVIVVDPPRKGCETGLLDTIVKMQPQKVVYVSCDPATLARDLKYLAGSLYEVERIRAVDQFGMTGHVETCVLLSHKKPDDIIEVKMEYGKEDFSYLPPSKVTYQMIQGYVERKYGFKVHTAYIAEVKRSLGLPMYDAPNAVEELKQPRKHPTPDKVEAIKDALKHFKVLK